MLSAKISTLFDLVDLPGMETPAASVGISTTTVIIIGAAVAVAILIAVLLIIKRKK